jgi:putative nucleotidyltransferase with HDIG domain
MLETSQKKHILFVDDEPHVLDGIRRMLYSKRNEWDMHFVISGKEALALMRQQSFDVVVSDMRMPEMDGATLLNNIKKFYPHVICFILSGYSDQEMIFKTVDSTDQFLSKPCDPEVLKKVISNALDFQNLISKTQLRAMVSQMKVLPTLPELYTNLKEKLESPKSSLDDIAKIVSRDVIITAKILQLANSAFFGLRHRISNVEQAVAYLGIETIKAVILTTHFFAHFAEEEIEQFPIRQIYKHSLLVGGLARKLIEVAPNYGNSIDEVSTAGILHDIGKVVFIKNRPSEYYQIYERHRKEKIPLYMLENERFGASHAEMGGYFMGLWGLPQEVIEAISHHHNPMKSFSTALGPLTALYIANILYHNEIEDKEQEEQKQFNFDYLNKLAVVDYLPKWKELAQEAKQREGEGDGIF